MSVPPTLPPLPELQPILSDHPSVRAALWHLDGLKQEGMSPELWLTERERAESAAFGHERRRREWTAARIALKRLLIRDGIVRSPLHAEIRKNELGQPRVVVYIPESGHYEEFACSLAHKNVLVLAAYARGRERVGIDIERRTWRLPHLRRRFESPADQLLAGPDSVGRYTVLWAFKEAASKLLGRGYACGFTQIVCRETRYGVCEISAPDGHVLHGLYAWMDRYVVALVSDLPHVAPERVAGPPAHHPWYEQLARARRLRRLRRSRALDASPHRQPRQLVLPFALADDAGATEGRPPPRH